MSASTPPNSKEELRKQVAYQLDNQDSVGFSETLDEIMALIESHTHHLLTEAFAAVRPEDKDHRTMRKVVDEYGTELQCSSDETKGLMDACRNAALAELDANIKRYMEKS